MTATLRVLGVIWCHAVFALRHITFHVLVTVQVK